MRVACSVGKAQINPNPLYILKKTSTGNTPLNFREHDLEWSHQEIDSNVRIDNVRLSFNKAIADSQFGVAVSIVQNEEYEYTKILAKMFDKHIEDRAYISDLFYDLAKEGVISEDQSSRLFVLLMVMDGLDMEVNEGGARVDEKQFAYLQEFIQIIGSIIKKRNVLAGVTDMIAEGYTCCPNSYDTIARIPMKESQVDIDEFFDCVYAWTLTSSYEPTVTTASTIP